MAYTTIDKPNDYFNTKLYTGTGSSLAITGVGFQPDWIWFKERGATRSHALVDSVRGRSKVVFADLANAEETSAASTNDLKSFDSDGFTVGVTNVSGSFNTSSGTHVAWNWKAGTTISSTSTSGSGTAKTYTGSVSTASGFSIIRYVGNGTAGHTIPHHLGAKPDVILVKHLGDGQQWATQWSPLGATKVMRFATTNAVSDSNTRWNDTEPTTSVFTLGNEAEGNTNDGNHIAYCFTNIQGYSKVGSYTGNGNADGPFVYTGFKPAFVLGKRTDSAGGWWLSDNKRSSGFNLNDEYLVADSSNAEQNDGSFASDFLSNGWKARATNGNFNADGGEYIYMAFAENPFVTSGGVPATAR